VSRRGEEFGRFVAARGGSLRRTAYLLTGDWHAAEDLTQDTFIRLYAVWGRLSRRDEVDAYARRTLVRLHLDERRRRRSTEQVVPSAGEGLAAAVDDLAEDRVDLLRALDRLPPRQRTVLVLRFWEDLDVAAVSGLMDCPTGTVKSLTSRALVALRAELSPYGAALVLGDEARCSSVIYTSASGGS
jgi:RNA polymerase sigma-70 factor (sigma-E family)